MRFARFWTKSNNPRMRSGNNSNGRALLVFYAVMLAFGFGMGVVRNFITPYLKSLGIDESVIGVLVGLGAVGAMLVSLPGGRLADAFGPKSAIIAYVGSVTAITALFPVLALPLAAMSLYVMLGATNGLGLPSTTPYIYGATKASNRGKSMSWYMITFYLGGIVGPILGGFLADNYGMKTAFFASAIICAAGLATAFALPPGRPNHRRHEKRKPVLSVSDIKEMLAVRGFKGLVFRGIALQTVNGISITVLSIFILYHLGISKASAGLVFGLASVSGLLTTPLGGMLSDRIGRKYPVIIGCSIGAVCFALIPLAALAPQEMQFPLICILIATESAGFGLSNPSIMALMSETMPRGRIGTGMGVYYTIATLGWVAGAPVAGVLFKMNVAMPFVLGGIVTIASVLIFAYLVPETASKNTEALVK
ncbi:MAG: hypothetical protein CVT47_02480 [Thermoplasmata archaeon HGW-Thermoplasmata-2]|nr:MAG: hypothetical protein CVT47_02480 [Thermoplasmata archaeon HGW-Thermoplasmata-2]